MFLGAAYTLVTWVATAAQAARDMEPKALGKMQDVLGSNMALSISRNPEQVLHRRRATWSRAR